MDPFDQPIQTLVLSSSFEGLAIDATQDYIFDASATEITPAFVTAYTAFLAQIEETPHTRVLVVKTSFLALFPATVVVVPTLGEAKDIIEMERIERDLGF